MTEAKEVTFDKLGAAIDFVEERMRVAQESAQGFAVSFQELTGMRPDRPVTALDVVKICYQLYGEPKRD